MMIDIDRISKEMICSIRLKEEIWHLYDCDGEELPAPSTQRIFSPAMKKHYLEKQKNKNINISTVWIMVGIKPNDKKICEQVGRTKNLINTLTEIKDNVKDFFFNSGKYSSLKEKNYKEIVFYEIDIDEYIKKDELFIDMYRSKPKNAYLLSAYYFIRAAYVEGKLGFETSAPMYHKSSLDEYFYEYYMEKCENYIDI